MGKLWFVNFLVFTFLILVILSCQSRQQKDLDNNLAEFSQELSKKIINDIYEKKDNWQLCDGDIDQSLSPESSSIYTLNKNEYLVEILCFFGAYQGNYQYFFYNIDNLQPKISPLYFQKFTKDKNNDFKVKNSINIGGIPDYNEENKILTVYTKGRGLDDCGSLAKYQWKESQFELLEYRIKDQCDGNYLEPENYPKIYP